MSMRGEKIDHIVLLDCLKPIFLPQRKVTLEKPKQLKHHLSFQRHLTMANSRDPMNVGITSPKDLTSHELGGFGKHGFD